MRIVGTQFTIVGQERGYVNAIPGIPGNPISGNCCILLPAPRRLPRGRVRSRLLPGRQCLEEDMKKNGTFIINELRKEESWRMFRIMGEFIEGFDALTGLVPAVTVYGSARTKEDDPLFRLGEELGRMFARAGYAVITGGGPGVMAAANKGAFEAGGVSVGLTIDLPEEQPSNEYHTLSLHFHHFFVRKVMLVKYAKDPALSRLPRRQGVLGRALRVAFQSDARQGLHRP